MVPTRSLLLLLAAISYHSPLGFRLELPEGFTPATDLPLGVTGAVPAGPGERAEVLAEFTQGEGHGRCSLTLAVVNTPLDIDTASAERLVDLAVGYVKDALDTDLRLEWVDKLSVGAVTGLELAGRFEAKDEERVAQMAFIPFGKRHLVVLASMPTNRFERLGAEIETMLNNLTFDLRGQVGLGSRAAVGGLVGVGIAVAYLVGRRFLRRSGS